MFTFTIFTTFTPFIVTDIYYNIVTMRSYIAHWSGLSHFRTSIPLSIDESSIHENIPFSEPRINENKKKNCEAAEITEGQISLDHNKTRWLAGLLSKEFCNYTYHLQTVISQGIKKIVHQKFLRVSTFRATASFGRHAKGVLLN